ncbi:MAG: rhodanese-like domain-containing protein, partial [Gammaproteobacteria bacterium]|nr:rhodanese-like domain-containing protein [Gammaproteobacteria bacterium]
MTLTKARMRIALLLLIVVPEVVLGTQTALAEGLTQQRARQAQILELYTAYRQADFPSAPDISVAELLKLQQRETVVLVDVREPREVAVSIIPEAISRDRYEQRRAEFRDRTVVIYCTIGYRSGLYVKQIRREGI